MGDNLKHEATLLFREYCNKMLMYLFWVHSGGSVATLTFMGACKAARSSGLMLVCLSVFVIGLISVGIAYAIFLFGLLRIQAVAETDRRNQIKWLDLAYIPGGVSFLCIIIAVILGGFGITSLDETDAEGRAVAPKQATVSPATKPKPATANPGQ